MTSFSEKYLFLVFYAKKRETRVRIFSHDGCELVPRQDEVLSCFPTDLVHTCSWVRARTQAGTRHSVVPVFPQTSCLAGSELVPSTTKNTSCLRRFLSCLFKLLVKTNKFVLSVLVLRLHRKIDVLRFSAKKYDTSRQFNQHFTYDFFVQIFWQSQNVTRKTKFVRKIRAFNVDEIDTS